MSTEQPTEEPSHPRVVVHHENATILEGESDFGIVVSRTLPSGLAIRQRIEPRRERDGPQGIRLRETDRSFAPERDNLTDSRHRTPYGRLHFHSFAQVHRRSSRLRSNRMQQFGFELSCKTFGQFFHGKLSKGIGRIIRGRRFCRRPHRVLKLGG